MTDREQNAKSHKVRLKIVAAARQLLAAGGIETFTMRGVAERVGLTATGIYYHFEMPRMMPGHPALEDLQLADEASGSSSVARSVSG